jgi:hypothetical protein
MRGIWVCHHSLEGIRELYFLLLGVKYGNEFMDERITCYLKQAR